jgi:hypothetical protein
VRVYGGGMRTSNVFVVVIAAVLVGGTKLQAQIGLGSLGGLRGGSTPAASGLSPDQASGGLKEALSSGIATSVSSTGRPGGYFENQSIKILMPPKLQRVEQGLRAMGAGPRVDEFVKSMNAAAEQAAPEAKSILLQALKDMSFTDARSIVTGGKTAGTDYFKRKTTEQIEAAFRPIVERAMAKTGVTQQFTALMGAAPAVPFVKTPTVDINQYVLDKAVDGLFFVMGQEETKIRTDPAAQVTPLLKTVFGGH